MSNQTNSRNQDNEAEAEHKIRLRSMEESVKQAPKSLIMTAGRSSCTVFRMPQSLKDIHPKAFEPRIISIGPYHHRKGDFKMIQEHKMRFLSAVLARTKEFHVGLDDFFKALAIKEKKIRECYSEDIECSSHDLIEMMVLDGRFVIQLFCMVGKLVQIDPNDPIFRLPWIMHSLTRDLLLLENQIRFFVLKTLFELSTDPDSKNPPSLSELVLEFIECTIPIAGGQLGLFRSTFIPSSQVAEIESNSEYLQLIQPAEKLPASGIKFKQRTDCESFLYIRFGAGGVLEIPTLTTAMVIAVLPTYTSYIIFMGCLINTIYDSGYLWDHKIIGNYFGTNKEVVKFFNGVGKDINFSIGESSLANAFVEYTYFDTPWVFMSALAAFILLIVTIIQSFFAVYGYFNPPQ
ncbi:hypothetical protein P3X46_000085 [Hevea brasiliensis]|uniref:Uncharacterized protein n=1 Tax=Hevea brasiliensis TaxID=3981 RepID=A0ABQ9N870_HEVBR|nr:hypothetical protein P3X46_000085 [Hevea brasiliensis]